MRSLITALICLLFVPATRAQSPKLEQAEKLYKQAYENMYADPEDAVKKLDQALNLAPKGQYIYCKSLWLRADIQKKPKPDCVIKNDELPPGSDKPDSTRKKVNQLIQQGKRFTRDKKFKKAIKRFKRVLQLDPANCAALVGLGITYARWRKKEPSARYCKMFLKNCPNHMQAPQVQKIMRQYKKYQKHKGRNP